MRKEDFPRCEGNHETWERWKRQPGQAAARGQFALFDKGRALKRCYQRHGAGSKGQGADGATAPRYRLLVLGCAGDTPASTGIQPRKRLRLTRRKGNRRLWTSPHSHHPDTDGIAASVFPPPNLGRLRTAFEHDTTRRLSAGTTRCAGIGRRRVSLGGSKARADSSGRTASSRSCH